MVEEHDFLCGLMWQHLPNLFEALGTFQQADDERFQILEGPYIPLLVLHLIVNGVLNELKAML